MKLLVLTCFIPYPFDSGGSIAQFAILEAMQHEVDITLCFPVFNELHMAHAQELQSRLPKTQVKPLDLRMPLPPEPGWKEKAITAIKLMVRGKQPAVTNHFDELDNPQFIRPAHIDARLYARLHEAIGSEAYDLAQVEFFEFLEVGQMIPAHLPKVFVHHEVRFERLQRFAETASRKNDFVAFSVNRARSVELHQLSFFDGIITFSDTDREALQSKLSAPVRTIPFPVLDKEMTGTAIGFINKLTFIGGEGHYPNVDGLRWFIQELFEPIWNQYQLPLYIIGEWSDALKMEWAQANKIVFTGYVDDYTALVNTSVMVSPIRIGSGIRTKILYGMAKGAPVLSTPAGAHGLCVEDGENILLANNATEFLAAVGKLMEDAVFKNKIVHNAWQYVRENFSQKELASRRIAFYKEVLALKKTPLTVKPRVP